MAVPVVLGGVGQGHRRGVGADRGVDVAGTTSFFIQKRIHPSMNSPATLADKIERLPPELRDRLGVFVDELLTLVPERGPSRRRPRLGWAGGLSESRDAGTSVELQHRALEWRQ